jgi:hypothetical protein
VIVPPKPPQTKGMVRVLTRILGIKATALSVLAAATVAACGGKAMDVGGDQPRPSGGSPGAGGTGTSAGAPTYGTGAVTNEVRLPAEELANVQWPADVACQPAPNSPLVGTWKGHWPDASGLDAEMVLTIAGLTPDGVPCGTVKIGDGPALPPVTDTNAAYPPSLGAGGGVGRIDNPIMGPWPGYEYQMLKVQSTATRLAFQLSYDEILRPWCQQQPAYASSFSCLPEWTSAGQDGDRCFITGPSLPETEIECFKMGYCNVTTCFCYDGRCDAAIQGTVFELHWDGPALEGSVNNTQLLFLDRVAP